MINKVILVGRITRDPEVRIAGGSACVSFTLACGRNYTDAQGNRQEMTDFVPCTVWRKQAENMGKFVKKGMLLGVEGRIQTRNYDVNGETRYVTEVLCDNVQFLESKSATDSRQSSFDGKTVEDVQPEPQQQNNYYSDKTNDVTEDDLPF